MIWISAYCPLMEAAKKKFQLAFGLDLDEPAEEQILRFLNETSHITLWRRTDSPEVILIARSIFKTFGKHPCTQAFELSDLFGSIYEDLKI